MDDVDRPPWWLSDPNSNDDASGDGDASGQPPGAGVGSWMSILGSLSSLAGEWWSASGASEHASHGEPSEHPDCLICRAMATVAFTPTQAKELPGIRWLPIRRL